MMIHEMTRQDCIELLSRARLCRLACANEGQPYIATIDCAYSHNYLYSFSTLGQKITWARANPLVCVEADELVSQQDWATVIVLGKYEELPDTPQHEVSRKRALDLFQMRSVWWEPGCLQPAPHDKTRSIEFIYFRIHIDQISGRRGIPDTGRNLAATHEAPAGWLRKIIRRAAHQKGDQ
jgi:nitroimidazol reductase NimA-like FMN-containing flavoprotein (pyridoxamine 5'-phosphate oxidase superfamily)